MGNLIQRKCQQKDDKLMSVLENRMYYLLDPSFTEQERRSDNHFDIKYIENLPDVTCREIISYLSWIDKLNLILVLPEWEKHLSSVAAWPEFNYSIVKKDDMESMIESVDEMAIQCIDKYGKNFQKIHFDYYLLDHDTYGIKSLQKVIDNCKDLKSLRLGFPVTFQFNTRESLLLFTDNLRAVIENCKFLLSITLAFRSYIPVEKDEGIDEILHEFIPFSHRLRNLEFDYCSDKHFITPPIKYLNHFTNLKHLKCPLQILTTELVILCSQSLQKLIVENSDKTLDESFREESSIDWNKIAMYAPDLKVNYIIYCRTLNYSDLVPNPLLHGIILDSLCNPLSMQCIGRICELYSDTLKKFIHLDTKWGYNTFEDIDEVPYMYQHIAQYCHNICTLGCTIELPASAILQFAMHSDSLENLFLLNGKLLFKRYATEEGLHDWDDFIGTISKIMKCNWIPYSNEKFMEMIKCEIHV